MKSLISGTSGGSASVPDSMSACAESYKSQTNGPLDPVITRSISTGNMSCATDDSCAINELLEGRMDLSVVLPAPLFESKKQEKVVINVERRQPMMDLLVNIATQFKFNAANYKINVDGHDFKANTAIGSLDVNEVRIVPKKSKHTINKPANEVSTTCVSGHQLSGSPAATTVPFKTTFRLQVNLPRNQLMVLRVTPNASIAQIKQIVCCEKGLDALKYQLVVCDKQPQVLDPNKSLAFYAINEVTLMSNKSIAEAQLQYSTSSACAPGCEPKKVIVSLLNATNQAVNSRENNRSSFAEKQQIPTSKPTKKRPAPQPPAARLKEASEKIEVNCVDKKSSLVKKSETKQRTITGHTRQNSESDSSGYHESMLSSDSPECVPPTVAIDNVIIEESCSKKVMKKRKAPLPPTTQQVKDTRDKFEANESMSEVSVPLSSASESSSGASQTSDYRTVTVSCCSLNGQLNESLSTGNISHPCGSSTPKLDASSQREEKLTEASVMEGSLEAAHATDCRRDSMNAITAERLNNDRNVSESEHAIVENRNVLPSLSATSVDCTVSVSTTLHSTTSPEQCALVNSTTEESHESDHSLIASSDKQNAASEVNSLASDQIDSDVNACDDPKAESVAVVNLSSNDRNGEDLKEDETVQGLTANTIDADGLLPPPPSFSDSVFQTMPDKTNETIDCITNCELVSKGGNELREQLFEAALNSDLHAAASVDEKDDDYFCDPCVHSFGEETKREEAKFDCDNTAVKEEAIENYVSQTVIAADSTTVTNADKSHREANEADSSDDKSYSSKQCVDEIHEIEVSDTIDDLTPLPPPSPFRNFTTDTDTVKCDQITDECVDDSDSKTNDEEYIEQIATHEKAFVNCVLQSVEPECEKMEQMKVTTSSDSHSRCNQHSILVQIKSDKSPISSTRIRVKSNPVVDEKQEYSSADECNEKFSSLDLSSINSQSTINANKNLDVENEFTSITSNEVRFLCRPRKKLTNFRIGSYKNDDGPNIYDNGSESNEFNSLPPKLSETRLPLKSPSKPVVVTASLKPTVEETIASEISAVPDSSTIKQTVQILPKSSTTRISMISPQPFKLNRISSWNGNERNLTMPSKHFSDDSSTKPSTIFEVNNHSPKNRCVSQVDINKDSTKVSVRSTPSTPSPSKSPDAELKTPLLIQTSRSKSPQEQKKGVSESKCIVKQISPSQCPTSVKSQTIEIRHESTAKHSSAAVVVKSVPAPVFPSSQRNGSSPHSVSNGHAKSGAPPPPPMPDKNTLNSCVKHVSKSEANAKHSKNVPKSNKKVIATNGNSNAADIHQALLNEIRNFTGGKPCLKKVSTHNPWQSSFNNSDCN